MIKEVKKVKLFVGFLTAHIYLLEEAKKRLEEKWGPTDGSSQIMDFNYTSYYEKEMGKDLKRQFMSFAENIDPARLPEIKVTTNSIEQELAMEGRRTVNIDPGYLTSAKIVLATTKDYAHRLYLGRGIYGEITLTYVQDGFKPLPWTYPDYRSEAYGEFFNRVREAYQNQMRKEQ